MNIPDEPDGSMWYYLVIAILFIFSGIYAACASYFHNLNENRLRRESDNGKQGAQKIMHLFAKHGEGTYQFGMIFWGICSVSAVSVVLVPLLKSILPLTGSLSTILSGALVVIGFSLFFFTFIVLLPKKILAHRAHLFTFRCISFLNFFYFLILPLQWVSQLLSDFILRLFGFDPLSISETVTEEEIMLMVGEGEERGVIEETEKDMIENILDFNDTLVSELMTHRIDMCAAEDTMSIEVALNIAVEDGRSRIPVFHDDIDSILGILYVKDLLPYIGKPVPASIKLTDIIRPAYFIPESKKCSQLFSELTEKKIHIAVIVDEYGGTSGLVTIEDLIESIVGNIQDEYDNEEEEIHKVNDYEFTVDGSTSIDEVSDLVDTELPEGDYDTIAGFVTELLGKILRDNEHPTIVVGNLEITVLEVEDQRIMKLCIKKLHEE